MWALEPTGKPLGPTGPEDGPKALGKRLAHGAPMAVPMGRGYDSVLFGSYGRSPSRTQALWACFIPFLYGLWPKIQKQSPAPMNGGSWGQTIAPVGVLGSAEVLRQRQGGTTGHNSGMPLTCGGGPKRPQAT